MDDQRSMRTGDITQQVTIGEEGFFDANDPLVDADPWGVPSNLQVGFRV